MAFVTIPMTFAVEKAKDSVPICEAVVLTILCWSDTSCHSAQTCTSRHLYLSRVDTSVCPKFLGVSTKQQEFGSTM